MNDSNNSVNVDQNKRAFVKKAAYVTPVIITMAAVPSFASAGSGWQQSSNPQSQSISQGRQNRDGRSR